MTYLRWLAALAAVVVALVVQVSLFPHLAWHGIVPNLCLHYPAAVYYFVAPDDKELASALELGLQRLRANGVMEKLFLQYHGEDLARARLGARKVIELRNPLLSPQTPLDKPDLWFKPQG